MSKIKQSDTSYEVQLRKMLHKAGFRFRKNVKELPGKPDIVLPKYRTVIFVHGCFWHRHDCKRGKSVPSANRAFWLNKFKKNIERDTQNQILLSTKGWKIVVVWQCELSRKDQRKKTIERIVEKLKINSGEKT